MLVLVTKLNAFASIGSYKVTVMIKIIVFLPIQPQMVRHKNNNFAKNTSKKDLNQKFLNLVHLFSLLQ